MSRIDSTKTIILINDINAQLKKDDVRHEYYKDKDGNPMVYEITFLSQSQPARMVLYINNAETLICGTPRECYDYLKAFQYGLHVQKKSTNYNQKPL